MTGPRAGVLCAGSVLVDVVKDVAPMMVGGFDYPFHELSTPSAELQKRLGYQTDPKAAIQEAKKLMAAAGHSGGLKNLAYSRPALRNPSVQFAEDNAMMLA